MSVKKNDLLNLTEDIFGRSVDATLSLLAYVSAVIVVPSFDRSASFQARIISEKFLQTINYDVIKNALITAHKKHYLVRRRHALPEITREGKKRLQEILPVYDSVRVWDKRLHIITYDIPERRHITRDLLRRYLHRLGCAKLQASVWLTPYNPVDTLRAFIQEQQIEGTIIVSDLGTDASVGEETIEGLISRLYDLESLNTRYEVWLDDFSKQPLNFEAYVRYLAILKDDPQLPFLLLPKWWKGDKAHKVISPLLTMLSMNSRP